MSQGRSNRSNPGLVTPNPPGAYFDSLPVSWRSQQHSTTTATYRQQRSLQPSINATTRSTIINRNQRTPASSLHYPSMHPDSLQPSRIPPSSHQPPTNTPYSYRQSTMEEYRYTPHGESRYQTNQPTRQQVPRMVTPSTHATPINARTLSMSSQATNRYQRHLSPLEQPSIRQAT